MPLIIAADRDSKNFQAIRQCFPRREFLKGFPQRSTCPSKKLKLSFSKDSFSRCPFIATKKWVFNCVEVRKKNFAKIYLELQSWKSLVEMMKISVSLCSFRTGFKLSAKKKKNSLLILIDYLTKFKIWTITQIRLILFLRTMASERNEVKNQYCSEPQRVFLWCAGLHNLSQTLSGILSKIMTELTLWRQLIKSKCVGLQTEKIELCDTKREIIL